jgi:nitrous oxidase accessory protein NosD
MKRTGLALTLILALLCLAVAGVLQINSVKANGFPLPVTGIYIRSSGNIESVYVTYDGSVPSTAPIQRNGNTYTFTSDILNAYVEVECDNIVIDGAGFTLQGQMPYGIRLENRSNVLIKNVNFKGFYYAVNIRTSSHIVIAHNGLFGSGGLNLDSSIDNLIANNNITGVHNVGIGIRGKSYNNLIVGNNFVETRIAVGINSGGNAFYHNNFFNSSSSSITVSDSRHINSWNDSKEGNYWSDYSGTDNNKDGIGDTPHHIINSNNKDNYPLMAPFDNGVPSIKVLSPENKTYDANSIPLNFTVNEAALQIAYSLDGEENVTISGNTAVTGLANGDHNITVYAKDEAGNVGSETTYFSVDVPFPTTMVIAPTASVAVVGVGLLLYFKKHKS